MNNIADYDSAVRHLDFDGTWLRWKAKSPWHEAGDIAGGYNTRGYYRVKMTVGLNKITFLCHRIIYFMHHGVLPDILDHIDRDKSNNSIDNLRPSNNSQNNRNRRFNKKSKTGMTGVSRDNQKYRARICIDNKLKHLGTFICPVMASAAYISKRNELLSKEI